MTLLIASVAAEDMAELKARAEEAWSGGADAVEVRIDHYRGQLADLNVYLRDHRDRTWIVTCRSKEEGGRSRADAMERLSCLTTVAQSADAYVDFELTDWARSAGIAQQAKFAAARPDGSGYRLILSAHDFTGVPANLTELLDKSGGTGDASAVKVAFQASHICDSFDALDLMHERGARVMGIAMGEDGLWTRVLAKKLDAFASYCTLEAAAATGPGQLTLDEMINRYRWSAIDASTKVFGVIGDPVAHSMSPVLFNRWLSDADVNAVYVPLRVRRTGDGVRRFLDKCAARAWLDIGGFSVTTPHKRSALQWVGGSADWMARRIGALNTVSFCDGQWTGHNTDCYAAVSSVADALGRSRTDLAGLSVDVLGTGGVARAVLYGFPMFGCEVTAYGRSAEQTRHLADEFGVRPAAWEDRVHRSGDVLINCTGVGMWPDINDSPMPSDVLAGCRLVLDVIYNPLETRLLRDASAGGCRTLNGLDMFVRQAAMQFGLWFSESPDTQVAGNLLRQEIQERTDPRE
jgi:3-dehydroquinate dehydratase/shikimate dehydrogenase